MESVRQQKVSRLLQRELGEIFQQESRALFGGALVTVTQVRISPDLSLAKAYLSVLAAKDKEAVMRHITGQTPKIRKLLGNKIRHQLRKMPELVFYLDDSLDYAARIDQLLDT